MMIPILNPNHPPKKWFDAMVRQASKHTDSPEKLVGWIWYHHLTPKKKREILQGIEGPIDSQSLKTIVLKRRRTSQSSQKRSATMAKRKKSRKAFKAIVMAPAKKSRKARKAKKTARKATRRVAVKSGSLHRPRVRKVGSKWYRAKRTKLFASGPVMLNPRRRHRRRKNAVHHRRHRITRRYNPKLSLKNILNVNMLMGIGRAGAGIAIGYLAMPIIYKFAPEQLKKNDKFFGLIHVAVGILLGTFVKNKIAKEVGTYIAATGAYDLIASNISDLGLIPIPRSNLFVSKLIDKGAIAAPPPQATSGSYGVPYAPVSPVARIGLSGGYQSPVSAGYAGSYQAPDMRTQGFGSDNPYTDIEGFDD